SCDLALAGVRSVVPFDEVVEAMYKVGKALPHTLRETALGGMAATPTGIRLRKEIYGE
ncbi:MAG: L-serine ammonia-lyase, iron-sulfur-dependent, subunit alpha, partial [Clostridium sp.]